MVEAAPWLRRVRVRLAARARIVGWCVLLLAVAEAGSVLLLREFLNDRLDEEVAASLEQEAAEIRALAHGRNPATGAAFGGDVRAIFDTFLDRNIPDASEALFTFVDGEPYRASTAAPDALRQDPTLVRRWSASTGSDAGTLRTAAGPVRYLAVPLSQGGDTVGVFVVANFLRAERDEVAEAVRTAAIASAVALLLASALAWVVAGRVLAPVRLLTDTAKSITDSDLTRRIPVEGNDEIAELSVTFNAMLDRLERAMAAQRAFMDDAGHELRTPITIIRGHLELLGSDPAEQREVVAIVTDELDRMTRLVDDMMLLARSERPDFLARELVDLGGATDEWLQKAAALDDREWRIDARASGIVFADRQRLTQAVMNLASNAVRHTPSRAPVTLGTAVGDGEARIWVRDEGPGIAQEEQAQVFERFSQGSSRHGRGEGAGLGLAIVRAIAEAHGGRVELESRPGAGARFTICIPLGRIPVDHDERPE